MLSDFLLPLNAFTLGMAETVSIHAVESEILVFANQTALFFFGRHTRAG